VGKARASRNAITHGLAARGPVDAAEVADRDRRAAALALEIAPAGPVEAALVDRLAAAFQRLEQAHHLEARLFDGAFRLGDVPPGCCSTAGPAAAGRRPSSTASAPAPPAGRSGRGAPWRACARPAAAPTLTPTPRPAWSPTGTPWR
jgi:hypothetical protein